MQSLIQKFLFLIFLCSFSLIVFAQKKEVNLAEIKFKKGGDVLKMRDGCYRLTKDMNWSSGAIWYPSPINLANDFEMEVELFFGCRDEGADGLVFIFSPKLAIGYAGEGMGFAGLYPSLGIEFDTYQNFHLNDPYEDHVAILKNGNTHHRYNLAGPIKINKNLEDCKRHPIKIIWNATSHRLEIFLDQTKVLSLKKDIVDDIFNLEEKVYWGISSATGGKHNEQKVCFEKLVFETVLPIDNLTFKPTRLNKLLKGDLLNLENVAFQSGKSALKSESEQELAKLLKLLKEKPDMHLAVYGHSDNVGNKALNAQLSQQRAESITAFLIQNGIDPARLSAKGLSDQFPIASNKSAAGRAKNRRIEVHLYIPIP
jgi:outer membrane protein OmpA-like peptidoglycan-associated protein